MGMRAQIVIPVLASILIIGISFNENFNDDGIIGIDKFVITVMLHEN